MNLRNPQASAGLKQAHSTGLGPKKPVAVKPVLRQSGSRHRLASWVCSLALLACAPLSHAQSGVVVIQIHVTLPTCAVPAGQTSNPSALPVQLDPRCRVASVIVQTPVPTDSAGATAKSVVQVTYQ